MFLQATSAEAAGRASASCSNVGRYVATGSPVTSGAPRAGMSCDVTPAAQPRVRIAGMSRREPKPLACDAIEAATSTFVVTRTDIRFAATRPSRGHSRSAVGEDGTPASTGGRPRQGRQRPTGRPELVTWPPLSLQSRPGNGVGVRGPGIPQKPRNRAGTLLGSSRAVREIQPHQNLNLAAQAPAAGRDRPGKR